MQTIIMPRLSEVAGPNVSMNFPDNYKWPPVVIARQVFIDSGRKAGEYKVPEYGVLRQYDSKDGKRIDWTYTGDDGRKGAGSWSK